MYTLIGADGKEYGPVGQELIRQWISEGRLNGQSKVREVGADAWKLLRDIPELVALLIQYSPPPPPIPPRPQAAARTSRLAIASVILAVLGVPTLGATAVLGLIFGVIALVQIGRSRGALRGFGAALTGTVLSTAFLLVLPLFAAMLLPALFRAKGKAQTIHCMNNLKQVGLAGFMYADDHKTFPTTTNWCDALTPLLAGAAALKCPEGDKEKQCHYAFNSKLAGLETAMVQAPAQTVAFFECEGGGWNIAGGPELLPKVPRHRNVIVVVFADGHAEAVNPARISQLRWDPTSGSN
jgi:prepilin-type processing-associated H-X9-DG protein